jgi:hypothetical protein
MEISRKTVIIIFCAGLALIGVGFVFVYALDSDRCLARSWEGFIADIEDRNASATAGYLDGDYSDSWGYTQQTLSSDLRRMMPAFSRLTLTLSDVTIDRSGARAVISARVGMTAGGYGYVTDAARQINGLKEPFVLHWKRDGLLPWKWKVVRIEQAEFDARRYGAGRSSPLSWPF